MENQLLICFTLITSGVLILIKIFLFDSKIDEIASIFAITQIVISLINVSKKSLVSKTLYFQYFILVQQIIISTQFTFLFVVISSIISRDLKFENCICRLTIIMLLLGQIGRIAFYWQSDAFQITLSLTSFVLSILIFLKLQIKKLSKEYSPRKQDEHNNIVHINSQTNVVISLKHLDSEFTILDSIPVGVLILGNENYLKYLNTFAKDYFSNFTGQDDRDIVEILKEQLTKLLLNYYTQDEHSYMNDNNQSSKPINSSIKIDDPINTILTSYKEDQFHLIHKFREFNKQQKQRAVKIQLYKQYYKSENLTVILLQDISSKNKKKELTQYIRFQNNIINSFSHELRTPLNSSLQILEVLSQKLGSELNRDYIQPAINSNRLLLFQINDILDYAALQSDQFSYNFKQFNIKEVFETITSLFSSTCQSKSIRLSCKAKLGTWALVNDKQRILQVIINLVNNSIKFSPQNTHIRVQFKNKCKFSNFFIKVKVKDQGFGISEQKLSFLLKELKSVSSDESCYWTTQNQLQAGIGLKISNRLIKGLANHDSIPNTFFFKTEYKKFTQVSFFISDMSVRNTTDVESISNVLSDEYATISMKKSVHYKLLENINPHKCDCQRILIVDDVSFNIQALKLQLLQHKIKCDQAFNGIEAVELVINRFQKKQCHPVYDLIIMDIEMPMMNGIIAAQKILQFFNSIKLSPPAIIVSSAYDQSTKDDLTMFTDCLPKPIDSKQLTLILRKYLNDCQ